MWNNLFEAEALSAILIDRFPMVDSLVAGQYWWVSLQINENQWVPRNPGTPVDNATDVVQFILISMPDILWFKYV